MPVPGQDPNSMGQEVVQGIPGLDYILKLLAMIGSQTPGPQQPPGVNQLSGVGGSLRNSMVTQPPRRPDDLSGMGY